MKSLRSKWRISLKLPVIAGEDLVKYLAKQGFEIKRQSASHVVVQKEWRVFFSPAPPGTKEGNLDRYSQTGRD
ncbi:MAG: type II toxin-antitoxin system HicA family toxin [Methanoregula sp.]|nr:type II toxin-antitoxin system HicA family toxin [Methanoregula sp.]